LGGNLGELTAMPLVVTGTVGDYPPVRLAFAWTRADNVPLILGQMNFFREFDICFIGPDLNSKLILKQVSTPKPTN
jgi:hypothetical protein